MQWFLFLLACDNNNKINIISNREPEIYITSHSDGDEVFADVDIEFRAGTSDYNDLSSELEVEWRTGDRVLCPYAIPDINGGSICVAQLSVGDNVVTAIVRDDENASGTTSVELELILSDAPSVSILSPRANGAYYRDLLITFEGEVADAEDSPSEISVIWESSIDGVLNIHPTPDSNGHFSDFSTLSVGEHGIKLSATDSSGKTATTSTTIVVKESNTPPNCNIIAPQTGTFSPDGELVIFQGTVSDADIPATELHVEWVSDKDGIIGTSTPNSSGGVSFPYSNLSINTHVVSMIVQDEVDATCISDIIVTVGAAPEITLLTPIAGDRYSQGENIVFSAQIVDNEDAANSLSVEWESSLDGIFSTTGPNSSGVAQFTKNTLSSGSHVLTVRVTDSDGLYANAIVSFDINAPPSVPNVSISPSPAYTTDSLVAIASGSIDPEGSTVSYSYEWFLEGVSSGITTSTLAAIQTSKGDNWTVRVTPSDGFLTGAYGTANITIANTIPEVSSISITPTNPSTQDDLTCSYTATDADGDVISATYAWFLGGNQLSSISSVLSGPFQEGDILTCRVTPYDGNSFGAYEEASVTITNTSPIISSVSIQQSVLYTNDVASAIATAFDADGDPLTYTWDWYVDSGSGATLVHSQTTNTASNSLDGVYFFDKEDHIFVELTVSDGTSSSVQSSNSVLILNSAPSIFNEQIDPVAPIAGIDDLICASQTSDADGDSTTLAYAWTKDGNTTSYTTSTISSSETANGQVWTCILTPNDGTVDGVSVSVTTTIGANSEGAIGHSFCASAGKGIDSSGYTMTSCLAEVGIAGTIAADTDGFIWQPGSIFVFDPQ